jgi:hypothetical protein
MSREHDHEEEDNGWSAHEDEDDGDDFTEASQEPVGAGDGKRGRVYVNPLRRPMTDSGRAWIGEQRRLVEAVEMRTRRRRLDDQRTFDATLSAILSDMAVRCLLSAGVLASPPPSPLIPQEYLKLFIVTRNRSANRYTPPWTFSETLRSTLRTIAKAGLIELQQGGTGEEGRISTSISPTSAFIESIRTAGLVVADFGTDLSGFEPVQLKDRHRREHGRKVRGELIDYRETKQTRAWREELREITAGLFRIDLTCTFPSIDQSDRAVYRVFNNGEWDQGGRMFGGFWLSMPKKDRREHLMIEGEEIVHVDFGQLHPRLAYWSVGREPPSGDLYVLPGLGIEHRKAVKQRLNALMWPREDLGRTPRGQAALLPPGLTSRAFVGMIQKYHHGIADLFGTDIGYRLLRAEGDVMVKIVQRCLSDGLPVLPVQDCLVCKREDGQAVGEAMQTVFGEMFGGASIPVGIE